MPASASHRDYAGNFPLWLAPDQVRVITLNDDAALIDYAKPIVNELRAKMVRVEADLSATLIKAKTPRLVPEPQRSTGRSRAVRKGASAQAVFLLRKRERSSPQSALHRQ